MARDHKDVGTCMLCIELRWGVGMLCIIQFISSIYAIFSLFIRDIRYQPGGYNPHFVLGNNIIESFGILLAIFGFRGIYQGHASWVWWYLIFLYLKTCTSAIVFFADYWELSKCIDFSDNATMGAHYANATLEHVAVKGLCNWTKTAYVIGWLINFTFILYFTYVTHLYYERTKHGAIYLLSFGGVDQFAVKAIDNDLAGYTPGMPPIPEEENDERKRLLEDP